MTKQLIALAIAATFGIAHAADVKPAVADLKAAAPAAAAAVVKTEAPKVAEAVKAEVKAPEAKPAAAAPVEAAPQREWGAISSPHLCRARCTPSITSTRTPMIGPSRSLEPSRSPSHASRSVPSDIPMSTQGISSRSLSHRVWAR